MTKHHDHVLFGSANCTTAALSGAGGNAEACVYRRLTSGTAVDALGLDRWIDADRLELSNLAEREDVPEIPLKALEARRSEEHTSELQSLMRMSYAVFCLNK